MTDKPDYASIVTSAEKAVKDVKDPSLRAIAYQRVLDAMLAPAEIPVKKPSRVGPRTPGSEVSGFKAGPKGYLEELTAEGFFREPKTIGQIKVELENRGHHIPSTTLSGPLQMLCQRKLLRRKKVPADGKKPTFAYSQW